MRQLLTKLACVGGVDTARVVCLSSHHSLLGTTMLYNVCGGGSNFY